MGTKKKKVAKRPKVAKCPTIQTNELSVSPWIVIFNAQKRKTIFLPEPTAIAHYNHDISSLTKAVTDKIKEIIAANTHCIYIGINCLHRDLAEKYTSVKDEWVPQGQISDLIIGMIGSRYDNAKFVRKLERVTAIVVVESEDSGGCEMVGKLEYSLVDSATADRAKSAK